MTSVTEQADFDYSNAEYEEVGPGKVEAVEDHPYHPIFDMGDVPNPDDAEFDTPDADTVKAGARARGAIKYEKKMQGLLQTAFASTVGISATVPDAAALLMHSPNIAKSVGDLAASDPKVARGIDFLTEGTDNAYLGVILATVPLVLQVIRNHEPSLEPEIRGIKIPFTKRRFKIKFGIKLGRIRNVTNDPKALYEHVFTDPKVVANLKKRGTNVAPFAEKRK